MADTMFKTAQEMLDQRRKDTQDNLLAIKAIETKQRERPLSGYAKAGGMLGEKLGTMAGESLKDYFGIKNEGDYLRDYESGIEQRGVMEQNLGAEGSEYSPEVAAQVLAQQDRFIEESGSNLSPEIKRTSDFTRTMKGLTLEQLNDPMQVAKVYNDFGYTQQAVELLSGSRMTPFQKAQMEVARAAETRKQRELNMMYGGGTGVGGGTQTEKKYKPGDTITNKSGEQVVVQEDGSLISKKRFNAQQAIDKLGTTFEPSQAEKTFDFLTSPFRAMGDFIGGREVAAQAQMVSKALKKNSVRPTDIDAMRDLVNLSQEESGLTPSEYNIATQFVTTNPK